jgi:hypothetical protein
MDSKQMIEESMVKEELKIGRLLSMVVLVLLQLVVEFSLHFIVNRWSMELNRIKLMNQQKAPGCLPGRRVQIGGQLLLALLLQDGVGPSRGRPAPRIAATPAPGGNDGPSG